MTAMTVTYEPGQVAVATVRGVPNVRIMWRDAEAGYLSGWWTATGHVYAEPDKVTDIRPLVALDLADPNLVGCSAVTADASKIVAALRDTNSVAAHGIAQQIEAQTQPPRPAEPTGLGAVIEDEFGEQWIRVGDGPAPWMLAGASPSNRDTCAWSSLRPVTVLGAGVEGGAS